MAEIRPAVAKRLSELEKVAESFTGKETPFYVLGLIEGVRTRELLRDQETFTPERIREMCKQALGIENEALDKGLQDATSETWCPECGNVLS